MLETVTNIHESCIIESDNCSSQYKSAQHFDNIQNIYNKTSVSIIFLFSVTGQGKGEVDHVGELGMWEQGVKFLMPLIVRIFLELSLLRNQILS